MLLPTPPSEVLPAASGALLRKYRPDDGAEFFALIKRNAERLAPHFPGIMQAVRTPTQAARYVRGRIREWDECYAFFFAVCRQGEQVGQVRFKAVDWEGGKAEIAYFVDATLEGRRVMSGALATILRAGFKELGLAKIYARVDPANVRSQRLLRSAGFVCEGLIRQDFRTQAGDLADVCYYGLLRGEWERRQSTPTTETSPSPSATQTL